jgi:hypothetical protein
MNGVARVNLNAQQWIQLWWGNEFLTSNRPVQVVQVSRNALKKMIFTFLQCARVASAI